MNLYPAIANPATNIIGCVAICSLGRVGVVTGRETVKFADGNTRECWTGFGLDGRGPWATSVTNNVVLLAGSLKDYTTMVLAKKSQVLYR